MTAAECRHYLIPTYRRRWRRLWWRKFYTICCWECTLRIEEP